MAVASITQPPVAKPVTGKTPSQQNLSLNLVAGDTDPNKGYVLSLSALNVTGTKGKVTETSSTTVTYAPGTAFEYLSVGQTATDTFSYTISDGHGGTSTAKVTVTVSGVNLPPVVNPVTGTTPSQQNLALNLVAGDTDPNKSDVLSISALNVTGTKGTVTETSSTTVTYAPGTAFASLSAGQTATDTFSYTISDGHGGTSTSKVTVTISGGNQPPVANPVTGTTPSQQNLSLNLVAGDTDPNKSDVLSISALNVTGTKGKVTETSSTTVTYAPGTAFEYLSVGQTATDTFSYTISDGHGGTSTAKVTVTVSGVNLPPVANPVTGTTPSQQNLSLNLVAGDTDPNKSDVLSISALNVTGTKGTVTETNSTTVTYAPGTAFASLSAGQTATDTFSYTISDGHGGTSTSSVTVTVSGVNQPPVANPVTGTTPSQQNLSLNLVAGDTDPNKSDVLSISALNVTGTKGTVTETSSTTVTYAPGTAFDYLTAGKTATDTFAYTISDGHGGTSTATATVTVTGVNFPPVAPGDTATTDSQDPVTINLVANATEPNTGDTLSVASVNTTGTKGTVTLSGTTSVVYSPGTAFNSLGTGQTATDTFGYTISNGNGGTSTAIATVTVTGVNSPPVVPGDSATTDSQDPVTINLVANVTELNTGDTLSVASVNTTGTKGTVKLSGTTSVVYSPGTAFNALRAGQSATDTFGYTISNGAGGTSTAIATVTVTGVNLPPVAPGDTAATDSQDPVTINLVANATEPNTGDTLSVASVNTTGTKGTVTLSGTTSVVYSPGTAFNALGTGQTATDTFGYTISNGNGGTSTAIATVTVTGVNSPPVAPGDSATTDSQDPVTINLVANVTELNTGDTLSVASVDTTGTKGTVKLSGTTSVVYSPGTAFNSLGAGQSATDTFSYTISNGAGGTSTAIATVTVTGVNVPPVAPGDAATTDSQDPVTINLVANATEVNTGDTLSVASVDTTGTKGMVKLSGTTSVVYSPGTAFNSLGAGQTATDTFAYTISNGAGGTSTAIATVTVTGVNSPPVAPGDSATTDSQDPVTINLVANATEVNTGDTLSVASVDTTGTKGTVTLSGTTSVVYSPGTAFNSLGAGQTATDTFAYTISNGAGGTSTAIATVTVTGVNVPPVAPGDTATTDSQDPVTINLVANATEVNTGDTLSVASVDTTGTKGTVTLSGTTSVVYSPGTAFDALNAGQTATDTFAYTISNGNGGTSTAIATVTVTGVNLPPVAVAETASTDAQNPVTINLLAGATDPNPNAVLTVSSLNLAGTNGEVTLNGNGTATYSPETAFTYLSAGETATDTFAFTISDGHGETSVATATVTVAGVNLPPVAVPDTAATDAQHNVKINLLANDSDPNTDDTLTVSALNTAGTKGSVTPNGTNAVVYSPGTAFSYLSVGETATDSFAYTVSDGHGGTSTAAVSVTVTGVNLPPVTTPFTGTTDADHPIWLSLLTTASDPNTDDKLSVTALNTAGTKGTVSLNPTATNGAYYVPSLQYQSLAPGQTATDTFSYTVSDNHGATTTGTATVVIDANGAFTVAGKAFYVATNGNDSWSGRLAQPNAAHTDGPFATLPAAQKAMEGDLTTQTTYVEGGDYYLPTGLVLTTKDSGQTWSAYNGQTVRLHGGTALNGWTNQGNGIWTINPPSGSMAQGGAINTLYVNGVAQIDARFPDPGTWLTATATLTGENPATQFQFTPGSIPSFSSTSGLYAVVFSQNGWSDDASAVSSINYSTDTITLATPSGNPIGAGSRFYLYNAPGQSDLPGEYYYDPSSNTLTYNAPAGFNGSGAVVGTNSRVAGIYSAQNVTLSGLTLGEAQSTGSAVQATSSTNVLLQNNTIDNTGNGVLLDGTSNNVQVLNNQIDNVTNNGILIVPGTSAITVQGNSIHDLGVLNSGAGIWFSGSSHDLFKNNTFSNLAKFGIGGGSTSGTAGSYSDTITGNTITNANQQTSDAGGIYLIGDQQDLTGDTISYNTVDNTISAVPGALNSPRAGIGAGIYLDDFTSGVTVYGNLLQNNVDGIWVHAGWNNTISHNVITSSNIGLAMDGRASDTAGGVTPKQAPSGNLFDTNTVYDDGAGSIASYIVDVLNAASWTGNIYGGPQISSQPFSIDQNGPTTNYTFAQWQGFGYDTNSPAPSSSLTLQQALANLPS